MQGVDSANSVLETLERSLLVDFNAWRWRALQGPRSTRRLYAGTLYCKPGCTEQSAASMARVHLECPGACHVLTRRVFGVSNSRDVLSRTEDDNEPKVTSSCHVRSTWLWMRCIPRVLSAQQLWRQRRFSTSCEEEWSEACLAKAFLSCWGSERVLFGSITQPSPPPCTTSGYAHRHARLSVGPAP